jgi:hypothetical protein
MEKKMKEAAKNMRDYGIQGKFPPAVAAADEDDDDDDGPPSLVSSDSESDSGGGTSASARAPAAAGASPSAAGLKASATVANSMSVKELKVHLGSLGVDYSGAIEKSELVALAMAQGFGPRETVAWAKGGATGPVKLSEEEKIEVAAASSRERVAALVAANEDMSEVWSVEDTEAFHAFMARAVPELMATVRDLARIAHAQRTAHASHLPQHSLSGTERRSLGALGIGLAVSSQLFHAGNACPAPHSHGAHWGPRASLSLCCRSIWVLFVVAKRFTYSRVRSPQVSLGWTCTPLTSLMRRGVRRNSGGSPTKKRRVMPSKPRIART